MFVKGIYLDKSIILKKKKDSFEIIPPKENLKYKTIYVIPPSDALVLFKDANLNLKGFEVYEMGDYKIISKKAVDFENEDIWVFSLLRALKNLFLDDVYVVFSEKDNFFVCYVKDNKLQSYEVFFEQHELLDYLNTLDKDILLDVDIDFKSLNTFLKKGELLAFGAALKYIDSSYKENFLSYAKVKKELLNLSILLISILLSYVMISFSINIEKKDIENKLKAKFEKYFPHTPIVDIKEQIEASVIPISSQFRLSKLLLKAYSNIPSDAKVYSLDYNNGVLKVKSEVNQSDLSSLKNVIFSKNVGNSVEVIEQWKN